MKDLFKPLILLLLSTFLLFSCQLEPLEPQLPVADQLEQNFGPFNVQSAEISALQNLGQKMNKRLGVNVIRSAQSRELSDFIFDLDASLVTLDSNQRKTYTVPFLSKDDRYSTFNLVIVTDSLENLLEQYVLAYEFDSTQYNSFLESGDFLQSGTTIKRFSFSSFFNDSNPFSLERCQGITDENGDPVVCDQVTIDAGSGGGGGSSNGGTAWITPGGATGSGNPTPSSGSSGSGGGIPCSWTVTSVREEVPNYGGSYCESSTSCITGYVVTISCGDAYSRKSASQNEGMITCMDCDISDFGNPAFTPFPEEDHYFETTITPDDGFNFQGEKVEIPTNLILQNGDQIKIEFGITQSDKKSANQEIAKLLLEGIKHAIEKANLKLNGNEKITSIYIAATTNGNHGPGSNHYNGTAIDISRINGVKMSVSGITNQIVQLQIAMDNFPNVRENFGPHFKHKFSKETGKWNYSHPVRGHSDHIHFSIR